MHLMSQSLFFFCSCLLFRVSCSCQVFCSGGRLGPVFSRPRCFPSGLEARPSLWVERRCGSSGCGDGRGAEVTSPWDRSRPPSCGARGPAPGTLPRRAHLQAVQALGVCLCQVHIRHLGHCGHGSDRRARSPPPRTLLRRCWRSASPVLGICPRRLCPGRRQVCTSSPFVSSLQSRGGG